MNHDESETENGQQADYLGGGFKKSCTQLAQVLRNNQPRYKQYGIYQYLFQSISLLFIALNIVVPAEVPTIGNVEIGLVRSEISG